MKNIIPFITIAFLFIFSSCEKEESILEDPNLVKYFGTWEFKSMDYGHHWYSIYTPNGAQTVYSESETITFEYVGNVSMGREIGELKIDLGWYPSRIFYARVDDLGNLICTGSCENIPSKESDQPVSASNGEHQITDSTYSLHLGSYQSGYTSSHSYYLVGTKL